MADANKAWTWHLTPNHWIDLTLTRDGLSYMGTDWDCQSGGGYMAGFQSVQGFLEDGPLRNMPSAIEAEVRAALADREPGHRVIVRVGGEPPDEAHCELWGHGRIVQGTDVIYDGELYDGEYTAEGVLLYPGADAKGRRRMKQFEHTFVVSGPATVVITEFVPRFKD